MNLNELPDMSEALKMVQEGKKKTEKKLDDVDPKELKGSHADRKDGDIDNDGDEDETDEYLHNRRKTISKAIKKEEVEIDESCGMKHGKKKKGYKEEIDFDIVAWAEEVITALSESEEIDELDDEDLISLFEEALLELSEDPDEIWDMTTILELMDSEMECIDEETDVDVKRTVGGIKRKIAHSKKMDRYVSSASQRAKINARKSASDSAPAPSASPAASDEKKATRGERLKAAAKGAAKAVKKAAVKTASAAGEVAGAARGGYEKGRSEAGGSSRPAPRSSRPAPRSSSSRGETRAAAKSALGAVGRLIKKGVKKAVGKTSRLVSRGSDALARRLGEDYERIDSLVESGLFEMHEIENIVAEALSGERYKKALKKGKMYSRKVSADPDKRATRGGRGGESDFGAGDRGAGNKAARRAGTYQQEEYVGEATAMAKRGHDETAIRNKIAKSTGGGEAADRASALEDRPTYGDANKAKQRSNYARKQRGDFRNTTSSSPGLHGYAHKSDDPKVKAKQAARGAQRGALTPAEKKQLNREEYAISESVMQRAKEVASKVASKAKEAYKKEKKFGKASPEAIDRLQRMNVHKQDKYGPSTLKQRLKTGAEHNIDNEKKAKEGK